MPEWIRKIRLKMSLLQQFRLASLVILVVGLWGVGSWIIQQIETGVVHSTSITTSLYVESLLQPNLAELGQSPDLSTTTIKNLDDLLSNTSLGQQIVSLKVWNTNGGVLYDTHHTDTGKTFPIEDRLARASNGEVTTRISPLDSDENVAERPFGQLIETYSPIHQGSLPKIIGVIEFYQKMDDLRVIIDNAQRSSWLVVAGVGLMMFFC